MGTRSCKERRQPGLLRHTGPQPCVPAPRMPPSWPSPRSSSSVPWCRLCASTTQKPGATCPSPAPPHPTINAGTEAGLHGAPPAASTSEARAGSSRRHPGRALLLRSLGQSLEGRVQAQTGGEGPGEAMHGGGRGCRGNLEEASKLCHKLKPRERASLATGCWPPRSPQGAQSSVRATPGQAGLCSQAHRSTRPDKP